MGPAAPYPPSIRTPHLKHQQPVVEEDGASQVAQGTGGHALLGETMRARGEG